ncbi:hypothetical protein B0H13DRAFT_1882917 [Mycena leptocephala]|nr:hypothetical protein B0H13DRAFT_1882917 [Mycena leptocephala]
MAPYVQPPMPTFGTLASVAGEMVPGSLLRTTTTIMLIAVTLAIAIHAASPTRMIAVLDSRLQVVEQIYEQAMTMDPLRLISSAPTDNALARRLIELQDTAASLRTQTLRYRTSSVCWWWWDEICACCKGHSLVIWRCSQELTALHNAIQLRNEETRGRFYAEVASFGSPVIQLALRHRFIESRPT